jgi:hypothetical protein
MGAGSLAAHTIIVHRAGINKDSLPAQRVLELKRVAEGHAILTTDLHKETVAYRMRRILFGQ